MASGPLYRLRQFRRALGARPAPADLTRARSLLTDAQWRLFAAISPRDQWHAVETLRLLGPHATDPDLAIAALLHDAGKGYIRLHERVLYVLLARLPRLLNRLAAPHGMSWCTALWRTARHAETGARLALTAGCSARTAELIRRHHAPDQADPAALALLDADDHA